MMSQKFAAAVAADLDGPVRVAEGLTLRRRASVRSMFSNGQERFVVNVTHEPHTGDWIQPAEFTREPGKANPTLGVLPSAYTIA